MRHRKNTRYTRIKNSVKDYFTFTKSDRKGIRALLTILIILMGCLYYTNFIKPPSTQVDIAAFEKEIKAFEASLTPKKENVFPPKDSASTTLIQEKEISTPLFEFNPNNLPEEDWKKLGAPDWIIKRIKNYEAKGGRFRKKEDLQKIYSMPPDLYQKLEPYIAIAPTDTIPLKTNYYNAIAQSKEEEHGNLLVDINLADETELDALPLIGAGRAKAIIAYRNKLHGFAFKEQLLEVWSINDTVYNAIADHVEVKAKAIQPININTTDPRELFHPYISYQLSKLIMTYRTTHGDYQNIEDIKKLPLVNGDLYAKLAPYLTTK